LEVLGVANDANGDDGAAEALEVGAELLVLDLSRKVSHKDRLFGVLGLKI